MLKHYICCILLLPLITRATELRNHVPKNVTPQTYVTNLPPDSKLHLTLGLPLRDPKGLDLFLADVYNPQSTNYHKFLSTKDFADRFAPNEATYSNVIAFAQSQGFAIARQHGNRLVLEVDAPVSKLESSLRVKIGTYHRPDGRIMFAPDKNPVVPNWLAIQDIQGLTDDNKPRPAAHIKEAGSATAGSYTGLFIGKDFRKAFASDSSLTGSGQLVGLVEFDGYYAADITKYAAKAGLTAPTITKVLLDGMTGAAGAYNSEVALDIDMSMSLAPKAGIVVFEGQSQNSILSAMTARTDIKQFSCSWIWGGGINVSTDNLFKQMAAQGQSFFQASGDYDAYHPGLIGAPADSPYITLVGGTTLSTDTGGNYVSEMVWNWAYNPNGTLGSSGGVSGNYSLPYWQAGTSTTANGASTIMRNVPDVAMPADKIYVIYNNGTANELGGTSCAAPLWAAFTSLINQQASQSGNPSVGFLNPALYAIAKTATYTSVLHDITAGNNFQTNSAVGYYAEPGYDLCTGLGSPRGQATINALCGTAGASTPFTGAVQVSLNPPGNWLLDGVAYASGAVVSNLTPQMHALSLPAVTGWTTPTNKSILVFSGTTNIQNLSYVQASVLQVNIFPTAAVLAGAGWYLDGANSKHTSGSLVTTSIGTHTVSFSTSTNWQAPAVQELITSSNITNVVSATYVLQNGWVTIKFAPTNINNSANCIINATVLGNGSTSLMPAGVYPVSFLPVPGWYSPTNTSIVINGTKTNNVVFSYRQIPVGNLKVTVSPVGLWALDNGAFQTSGVISNIPAGTHQLSFIGIPSWVAPANRMVVVPTNATVSIAGLYSSVSGSYAGLFYDTNNISAADAGAMWVQVATNRAFTGKLQLYTNYYSFHGAVQTNGFFTCTNFPVPYSFMGLSLDSKILIGNLNINNKTQELTAFSTPYSPIYKTTNNGVYTVVISGANMGYGFGALTLTTNGSTAFTGMLGDGTVCSTTNVLNSYNEVAWYIPLTNSGLFLGWTTFSNQSSSDLHGAAYWVTADNTTSLGTSNCMDICGSRYSVTSTNMLHYRFTMQLTSSDNSLTFSNYCYFGLGNKFTNAGPATCVMTVGTNGIFSGTMTVSTNQIPFGGVLYEKLFSGFGLYPWKGRTGALELF